MSKNTRRSILLPVTISVLVTIGVFAAAEYIFHIPSRFFQEEASPIVVSSGSQDWDHTTRTGSENEKTITEGDLQSGEFLPSEANIDSTTTTETTVVSTGMTTTLVQNTSMTDCTLEYTPVCGADGRTYSNSCMANRAKTIVAYGGDCKQQKIETIQPTEVSVATGGTLVFGTGSYHIYTNTSYSFALPKYAYYSGFGAQSGASHTIAVGLTSSGVDAFATADVRVYFFKVTPANPPEGKQVPITNGVLYISGDASNPKIAKIIDTIEASAK